MSDTDKLDFLQKFFNDTKEYDLMLERAKRLNGDLKVATRKILSGLKDLKRITGGYRPSCTICFEPAKIMYALLPCAHTLCRQCKLKLFENNPPRCFSCRTIVGNTLRLYI